MLSSINQRSLHRRLALLKYAPPDPRLVTDGTEGLQYCTVRLFPQVHALTPHTSSLGAGARTAPLRRRTCMLFVVQACGCPHGHTCAGRCSCVLFVAQACGCPHRHTCAGRFTKGAASSAQRYPAATVSRRVLALTGIHAAFERQPPHL